MPKPRTSSTPKTPAVTDYRMPAEWEPHQATLLAWPYDERHWPGLFEGVGAIWATMIKELETGEDVHVLVKDAAIQKTAEAEMHKAGVKGDRVTLHQMPYNFPWMRDNGPIVVKNEKGERMFLDWQHNGWGGQWECDLDDVVPALLARKLGMKSKPVPMVLEGGSIDVNGLGTLITTENCLLNPNRNPTMNKEQIEEHLKTNLGVRHILWLGEGIMGDDTSGHVDDLTRFVGPKTVMTIVTDDPADPDYKPLQENLERLRTMKDQDGNALEIITIPQPKPVLIHAKPTKARASENGFRIPASYANFYIGNECVLLPVWDDPNDQKAIDILQKCFPTRRIAPVNSRLLTWGFGSFHCVTQQLPV